MKRARHSQAHVVKTAKRRKVPTVIQMEAVECGAAALAMVLAFHGRVVPLEELRLACGVSRDGVKALNMVKAAEKYGLKGLGYKREPDTLDDLPLPMIVHWNFNHFVVLEGVRGSKVYINDPAMGRRVISHEEFDLAFTGVCLVFEPDADFVRGGRVRSVVRSLLQRFRDPASLLFVLLAGLLLVLPGLATPIFSRIFVDYILVDRLTSWFQPLVAGMMLAAFSKAVLTWLQSYFLLRYRTKMAIEESNRYLNHLLRLPVVFFAQRMTGDLARRVANNDRLAELLTGRLATVILNFVLVVFYVSLMLFFDVAMTLAGILIMMANLVMLRAMATYRGDLNLKLMMEGGKVYGTAAMGVGLIENLKASGTEADFFAKWSGYHAKALNTFQALGRVNYMAGVIPPLLTQLTTALILVLGALRVMDGQMSVGMLVAFQSLMVSFSEPFNRLVNLGSEIQEAKGILTQLDDVFDYPEDPACRSPHDLDEGAPVKLSGKLSLRHLSFGYNRLDEPLIQDFSLEVEPGMRVAIVGGSGSGKSTIARLIAGLYEPWSGELLFDGRPRLGWPRETLINSLALVDQDVALFEGTIRENLTLWDSTIPDGQLIQAAKDAHIHDVITARPGGYAGLVAEGGRNFSGGQRQRLEIARGLVPNPTMLVLDEATSALDPLSEQIIDANLRRRGCSCIIVAHRLSTIRDCDEIIVMDHGRICQRGTHESLMKEEGTYASLIRRM